MLHTYLIITTVLWVVFYFTDEKTLRGSWVYKVPFDKGLIWIKLDFFKLQILSSFHQTTVSDPPNHTINSQRVEINLIYTCFHCHIWVTIVGNGSWWEQYFGERLFLSLYFCSHSWLNLLLFYTWATNAKVKPCQTSQKGYFYSSLLCIRCSSLLYIWGWAVVGILKIF